MRDKNVFDREKLDYAYGQIPYPPRAFGDLAEYVTISPSPGIWVEQAVHLHRAASLVGAAAGGCPFAWRLPRYPPPCLLSCQLPAARGGRAKLSRPPPRSLVCLPPFLWPYTAPEKRRSSKQPAITLRNHTRLLGLPVSSAFASWSAASGAQRCISL